MRTSADLSRRETQVAQCAATGATTRQIADDLSISVRTVESHLASIYRKLGVTNRTGLAALIARDGLGENPTDAGLGTAAGLAPCEDFVGRRAELDAIMAAFGASRSEVTRVVLVSGEPGAGKSTLIARAIREIDDNSVRVLVGVGAEGLRSPFGMLVDAVTGYLTAATIPLSDIVGSDGGVLATLIPSLADRLSAPPEGFAPAARPRLVADAIRSTLIHAARTRPTVLVLEDLHWADRTGIAVLERLAQDPPPVPLTVIGTFREGEAAPGDALFGLAADSGQRESTEHIRLGGLEVADAIELHRVYGGTDAAESDVEELHASTGGNALYLTSMLRELAEGHDADVSASSLRDLIQHRTARLDPAQLAIIEAAAVIGLDFELDFLVEVLGRVGDVDPEVLADTLERSVTGGVLAESADPRVDFRFAHDVVRQSVLRGTANRRRAQLHAAIGAVLADRSEDDPRAWPEIISHLRESRDPSDRLRAARFAARLGEERIATLDPRATAELLESVLAVLPRGHENDGARLDVLRALIDVDNLRLDYAAHREAVIAGVEVAERIGDPYAVADILTHYRLLPATGTTDGEILALVDEAVAALPGDDSESLRLSALLEGYATYHRSIGGAGFTVAADAEDALERARRSKNRTAIGTSLYTLAAVLLGSPDFERMQAVLAEFEPYRGDIIHSVDGHDGRRLGGCAAIQAGDRDGFDRFHARVRRLGTTTQSGFMASVAVMWDAVIALMEGRLEDAARINDALLPIASADPNLLLGWFVQMVPIRCAQGRVDEILDLADATLAEHPELVPLQALVAWAHFQSGDTDHAWSIVEPVATTHFASVPDDWTLAASITWLTPIVTLRGTLEQARLLRDRLAPYSGQLVLVGSASDVTGAADRSLGMLARRLGEGVSAYELLRGADDLERRAKAPYLAAMTRLEMIRLLRESDDSHDRKRAEELRESLLAESEAREWPALHQTVATLV